MKLIDELPTIVRLPLRGLIWLTMGCLLMLVILVVSAIVGWLFKAFPVVMWCLVGTPFVLLFLGWIGLLVEDTTS